MDWQGFLLSWTPEKAWWWGVTMGDGCVSLSPESGNYRVHLVGSESTVERWLRLIHPSRHPQKLKRANAYQGYVNDKAMVEWLALNGMGPRKTHSLQWPRDLPDELLPHFIRGLWDTDGSLSVWDRRGNGLKGNPELKARYASACESFVHTLHGVLVTKLRLPSTAIVHNCSPKGEWWNAQFTGPSALQLASYLYRDAPEHLRNEDRMVAYRALLTESSRVQALVCACGKAASHEGQCQACWWSSRRKTGEGTACACGKKVLAKGLCSACYSQQRRLGQMRVTNL